jgi:hypothetical protein
MSDLRDLRVDPPEGDFASSLHRRLVAAGSPDPLPWWRRLPIADARVLWPAFGAAAGIAVFLLLGVLKHAPAPSPPAATATRLAATQVAVVRVNLSAEVAVESAQIRVNLPEGLVFWAEGEELPQRSFEWTQPLRAGDNEIPVAVRGLKPGKYKMTVSARIGSERVEDEVLLEVVSG